MGETILMVEMPESKNEQEQAAYPGQTQEFVVKFADIPIRVHSLYEFTRTYCEEYLTDEAPLLEVTINETDILNERRYYAKEHPNRGERSSRYYDEYMERLALLRKVGNLLAEHNAMLFHGCVVAVDGKAYLFTARAGTGKTTHCRLWVENIPGSHIVNGDKPFLLFREGEVLACGTPWQGKERYGRNEMTPLAGVCILERDAENHIERISFREALPSLLNQGYFPKGAGASAALQLMGRLKDIPLYRLGCNMDREAAWVSYRGMTGRAETI